ncbi:hypothetical protein M2323_004607, partial [Rhodoblastus acidophilus]|uniref:hypothetical protein n=1 Tax=Rhodoblastus acidophilus TaxID=1074 RepID=UPI00222465D6
PKEASDEKTALIFAYQASDVLLVAIVAAIHGEIAAIMWRVAPEGSRSENTLWQRADMSKQLFICAGFAEKAH